MEQCLDQIVSQVRSLIEAELYDSAECLLSLFLSSPSSSSSSEATRGEGGEGGGGSGSGSGSAHSDSKNKEIHHSDLLELLGDILFKKKEYRRAFVSYQQAELFIRPLSGNTPTSSTSAAISSSAKSKNSSSSSSSSSPSTIASEREASLRLKEAKCMTALKDTTSALKCLESIPAKWRTLAMHCMLGDLYLESSLKRHAVASYKEAFLLAPYSVELAERLIEIGTELQELQELLQESKATKQQQQQQQRQEEKEKVIVPMQDWMPDLLQAFHYFKINDHRKSLSVLKEINNRFPRNLFLLSLTARSSARLLGHEDNTLMVYRHIQKLDKYYLRHMEDFAALLQSRGAETELCAVASAFLDAAPSLPVPWIVAAYYSAAKDDSESALSMVEKAIMLKPLWAGGFLAKGRLHLQQRSFDSALIAFSQANSIEKDLVSFIGMIESNLGLGRLKEAANWSRESIRLYPKSAESYYMMGNVLAKSSNAANEAVKAYARALKLQPKYEAAAVALSSSLQQQNKIDECIECLQTVLQKTSSPTLRLLLARGLSRASRHIEALEQLNISLALHGKDHSEINKEIERVEQLLREENQMEYQDGLDDEMGQESLMESQIGGPSGQDLSMEW